MAELIRIILLYYFRYNSLLENQNFIYKRGDILNEIAKQKKIIIVNKYNVFHF
ncbi:MAG: hypothetical protein ABI168_02375 [Ginsengibacter sp.]